MWTFIIISISFLFLTPVDSDTIGFWVCLRLLYFDYSEFTPFYPFFIYSDIYSSPRDEARNPQQLHRQVVRYLAITDKNLKWH
ncbi:hypothetical protein CAEBREN_03426 [Caenorhabditis brenneri]|uniref:Secreted protein n=1 Tax=Caenorhabditis brenneri TaxID=135651 RepID=G0ND11_CAEBE|nr:hypothetical protein CAEBREN_03426 [Caenorhabditis brenneri]